METKSGKLRILDNKIIVTAVSLAAVFLAILFVLLSGIVGLGRSEKFQQLLHLVDAKYLYLAGENWLARMNPYDSQIACQIFPDACDPDIYRFAYPPTVALFVILLAMINWTAGAVVFVAVNVLALFLLVYFGLRLLAGSVGEGGFLLDPRKSFFIAMTVGNIPVVSVFWMGQTSLMIAALMIMSFYCYRQGRDWPSGLCLALALVKPHLSYPLLIWFLLEGRTRIIFFTLVISLGLFLVPAFFVGLERLFWDWVEGIRAYADHPSNFDPRFTLSLSDELLRRAGLGVYSALGAFLVSLGLIYVLHRFSRPGRDHLLLGILMSLGLLFGQAHHYDLVLAAPVLLYFLAREGSNRMVKIIPVLFFFALFNLPRQDYLLRLGLDFLVFHREIILLGAVSYLMFKALFDDAARESKLRSEDAS
jgi:hypothetical protein